MGVRGFLKYSATIWSWGGLLVIGLLIYCPPWQHLHQSANIFNTLQRNHEDKATRAMVTAYWVFVRNTGK